MLPLILAILILAACGYALFGWRRLTAWWGSAAAALAAITATFTSPNTAQFMAAVVATIAAAALAATPALMANDLADNRTGIRTARVFGVASCLIVATAQLAIATGSWWLRVSALLFAAAACGLLVAARRRKTTALAARHMAVVIAAAGSAVVIGLLTGIETPLGAGAALLGLATFAGVTPWSAWLGRAHRAATAPVSMLLSAAVLPAGWYQLWWLLGAESSIRWLLVAGTALLTAATMALRASDIRVLPLAATIAHFGVASAAVASGTDVRPVIVVLLASGLACTAAAAVAGHIVALTGSGHMPQVRGLWGRHSFLAGLTAVTFGAAVTTPVMLTASIAAPRWWWIAVTAGYLTCAAVTAIHIAGILRGHTGWHLATGPARSLGSGAFVVPAILAAWAVTAMAGFT